jgi:hypothetical protein
VNSKEEDPNIPVAGYWFGVVTYLVTEELIVVNPKIMIGKPVIEGTCFPFQVSTIFAR